MCSDLYSTIEVSCVRNNADGTTEDLGVIGYYNAEHPELNFGNLQLNEQEENICHLEQQ